MTAVCFVEETGPDEGSATMSGGWTERGEINTRRDYISARRTSGVGLRMSHVRG